MNSNYDSFAAYREVQERHEDIRRIGKNLEELAELFSDVCFLFLFCFWAACLNPIQMGRYVEEQDQTIMNIASEAEEARKQTDLA